MTFTFLMNERFEHLLVEKLGGMRNVTVVAPKSE